MDPIIIAAIIIVFLALLFDFTNGFHDSANQVATVISSRALEPKHALLMAAVGNFIGAYFLGTAVAVTLGKDIIDPRILDSGISSALVIISALIGAIVWNLATWYFGIPSSSAHALIGGLLGAFVLGWGIEPIHWNKVRDIIIIMLLSPFVGFFATFFTTKLTLLFSRWSSPSANKTFKKLQIVSSGVQALAHGTNGAQKTMGVITFSIILLGLYEPQIGDNIIVPAWVIFSASFAIALGTMTGGWRIIKKLGTGLYTVRPIHGFTSQTAASAIIYGTALFGFPISTTQVISSSIMGAGAATRVKMVRWLVVRDMLFAWTITIPVSAAVGALTLYLLQKIF